MSKALKRNAPFLKLLYKSSPNIRKKLLRNHCSPDFIDCICECAKNVLKGNVPLSSTQKEALRRRKRILKHLSLKKTSRKKRKQLIQSGGFLGALLGPIISVLGNLFGGSNG
jgi:hypothetical protein